MRNPFRRRQARYPMGPLGRSVIFRNPPAEPRPIIGVGGPGWLALNRFGEELHDAFGATAYLVGSAARGKAWRDVDIRLMLDPDEFVAMFGPVTHSLNPRWIATMAAWSTRGAAVTGLPIDFQAYPQDHADALYSDGPRHPLNVIRLGHELQAEVAAKTTGPPAGLDVVESSDGWRG